MWVGRGRYSLVRSFVGGLGEAKDDGVLVGFQQWLTSQPQHRAISNFTWPSLLLREVFPEHTRVIKPSWQEDPATADLSWPLPSPPPVSEDDLAYPDDDTKAIAHLFTRLREYLDSKPTSGGGEQRSTRQRRKASYRRVADSPTRSDRNARSAVRGRGRRGRRQRPGRFPRGYLAAPAM